jgi:hypothetical protein
MKKQRTAKVAQARSASSNAKALTQQSGNELLDTLLAKDAAPARQQALVHGVVMATLLEILPDGKVRIAVPSHGIADMRATPVCALQALREGTLVAVMFEQGDTTRALLIGPMAGVEASAGVATHVPGHEREAVIDEQRILIEAEQEIELRCGEAAIILTADGRILLRGTYISSHASATMRIRGGAVQIN